MAVQIWVGEKPEHPNERRTVVALANGLERLEGLYLLLVNFNVGGRTIDLAVIKHDAIFIIELKHCDGKIFGGVNGPWFLESANGVRKQINTGRSNPYNQVISCYYSLTNFLNDQRTTFLSPHKAKIINFRSCRRIIVIAPRIEEGSDISLDWKVELKGLDELPSFLVTEKSSEIELTHEEMLAIPKQLKCTQWHDMNELMAGILPYWQNERTSSEQPQTIKEYPQSLWQRVRLSLQTLTGRIALVMSILVVFLLIAFIVRPTTEPTAKRNPSAWMTMSQPAGGEFAGRSYYEQQRCVWSEFQSVGKRWDNTSQRWMSVGVDGMSTDMAPQVVITLEKVDYCHDEIQFFWGVRNNSSKMVIFPLQSNNITIRDPLGHSYTIADSKSQPRIVSIQPGTQEHGIMVVLSPIVQHAPSLLVQVRDKPFGEASWLVSLER